MLANFNHLSLMANSCLNPKTLPRPKPKTPYSAPTENGNPPIPNRFNADERRPDCKTHKLVLSPLSKSTVSAGNKRDEGFGYSIRLESMLERELDVFREVIWAFKGSETNSSNAVAQ